jgi:dTDP-4-dehydrorhamnose 3,5-epimerase
MDSLNCLMPGVVITQLKQIYHPSGDIFHALKSTESSFSTFGEAYFSSVHLNLIKGWKKHLKMTMNLVVPCGEVRFYFHNESFNQSSFIDVGESNYVRLTVDPGVWMAFQGLTPQKNLILNIASIPHDPTESINTDLSSFPLGKTVIEP